MSEKNGNTNGLRLKTGLAEMLKGGVIMDVTDAKQAEIAEKAGAVAVMALERVPAQIRAEGGRTPQIAFMVNTKAGESAQKLFDDLYKPGLYSDLWFRWQGRPLLLCDPKAASPEVARRT